MVWRPLITAFFSMMVATAFFAVNASAQNGTANNGTANGTGNGTANNGTANNNTGTNQGTNQGNQGGASQGGIFVDADGILRRRIVDDQTGRLDRRRAAAAARLGKNLDVSELRKVSLPRLESAVAALLETGQRPNEEMAYLAGLTEVQYVFFYPETRDIVLAGPAEPPGQFIDGHLCGRESGRPLLHLEDIVVALRTHGPLDDRADFVSCSIDPTPEGLSRMQAFLRRIGPHAAPRDTQFIVSGLRTSLGMQDVSFVGVPANTHFAHVLLEADYRMKLIGIGLERPPVRLTSYVSLANPAQVSRNAMQRWWFVPDYQCVRVSEDGLAMELEGDGVMLVGEDEVVGGDGSRQATGGQSRASKAFVTNFTKTYPQLADVVPVFAQLRNLIDISVSVAFMRQQAWFEKADWNLSTFGDEAALPVESFNTPRQVETAVASLWKRNTLMTPVGGGVRIEASKALETGNLLPDENGVVGGARLQIELSHLDEGQWWWD